MAEENDVLERIKVREVAAGELVLREDDRQALDAPHAREERGYSGA